MKELTARDVMNREVRTVSPDLTVHELSVFLTENQFSGAPVADERGRLLGLVSLTDIAESDALREDVAPPRAAAARPGRGGREEDTGGLRVRSADLLVRDIMTPATYSVTDDTPVSQLAQTMVAGRIHRLLVMREHRLVGMVTSLDLLRLLIPDAAAPKRPLRGRRGGAATGILLAVLAASGCGRAGSSDAAPPGRAPVDRSPAPAGDTVAGTVTLAPSLQAQAPPGAALFLIARTASDRHIVAVRKEEAVTFPYAFVLSSQDAMTPGSSFGGALEITARLSRTGDAAPAPGDIEGVVAGVSAGSSDVRVELNRVRR